MFELKTFDEIGAKAWNEFVLSADNGSIHQISAWKSLQETVPTRGKVLGWGVLSDGKLQAATLAVRMKTGFMSTEWFYAGRGPVFTDRKAAEFLLEQITKKLRQETKAIFWRYDPYVLSSEEQLGDSMKPIPARDNYHPADSIVIDLSQGIDELWAQVKSKKRRYDIRHGQGVLKLHKISGSDASAEQIDDFYSLLQAAAQRDGFKSHPRQYYCDFLKTLSDYATLWLVELDGKPVAASITTLYGQTGIYYFAALTDDKAARRLTPAHFLLWEIIRDYANRGATKLDLLGVAPDDAAPDHPYSGITKFKSSFGGETVHYKPGYEISLKPVIYWLYRLAKRVK